MSQSKREISAIKRSRLIFISTTRLHYDTAGRLRSHNPLMSAQEWAPFVSEFDEITVVTRVDDNATSDKGYLIDEMAMNVIALPFYDGMVQRVLKHRAISNFISSRVMDPFAVYYVWVPHFLAYSVAKRAKRIGAPLIVRVMGDIGGVTRSIVPHPFKTLIARCLIQSAQRAVRLADGVVYVTLGALQKKYPAKAGALSLARTNIQFSSELMRLRKTPLDHPGRSPEIKIIAVGSQQQNYKGHDILIEAVAILQDRGYDLSLTLVGSGRLHEKLKAQARDTGVDNVRFIKRLGTSVEVAECVSEHDLFVMPSRTEGMPKALLEAMSVGVLSIGSEVGGIPEVLDKDSLFAADSSAALVDRIIALLHDDEMTRIQHLKQAKMVDLIRNHHSGPLVLRNFLGDFKDHFA